MYTFAANLSIRYLYIPPHALKLFVYGDDNRDYLINTKIADAVHKFIIYSKRFDT